MADQQPKVAFPTDKAALEKIGATDGVNQMEGVNATGRAYNAAHGKLSKDAQERKYYEEMKRVYVKEHARSTKGTKGVENIPSAEAMDAHLKELARKPTSAECYNEAQRMKAMPWVTKVPREKAKNLHQMTIGPRREPTAKEIAEEAARQVMPFPLHFRPIQEGDVNFIFNAWMRSFRDSARDMRNAEYYHGQQNLIAEIAHRRQIIVGCDGDTPEFIVGFIVGVPLDDGRFVIDYIYVKHSYRMRGIARGLLRAMGWTPGHIVFVTHRLKGTDHAMARYDMTYNPYFNCIGFSDV